MRLPGQEILAARPADVCFIEESGDMNRSRWMRPLRLPGGSILPFGIAIGIACLVLQWIFLLWQSYEQTTGEAATGVHNLSATLAARLDASLRPIDATLQSLGLKLAEAAELPDSDDEDTYRGEARRAWVQEQLEQSAGPFEELANVLVFDRAGRLVAAARPLSAAWLAHYTFPAESREQKNLPWFSEMIRDPHLGQSMVMAALPIVRRDGMQVGHVAALISLERISALFLAVRLGEDSVIALRRSDDMRLLVRIPASEASLNQPGSYAITERLRAGQTNGVEYWLPSPVDGVVRITAFHKLERYPFYVAVSRARNAILANWQMRGLTGSAVTVFLIGLLFFTSRALARSEANFRSLFDTVSDYLLVLDDEDRILHANRTARDELGRSLAELIGRDFLGLLTEESSEAGRLMLGYARREIDAHASIGLQTARGERLSVEARTNIGKWNNRPALFVLCHDISERLRQQKQLEREVARRRLVLDRTRDGIFLMRANGDLVEYNPAFRDMLGYTDEEMARLNVLDWDARFSAGEILKMLGSSSTKHLQLETRHRRKDGSVYDAEVAACSVAWDGEAYRFGTVRDISARKKAERDLRTSEARFRAIFESSPIPYMLTTLDRQVVSLNKAFVQTFGYTLEDIPDAEAWWRRTCPDASLREAKKARWADYRRELAEGRRSDHFETQTRCKNGEMRTILVSFTYLEGHEFSELNIIFFFDITVRKRSEEQLRLYSTVFHHAGEGIAITAPDGTLLDVNEALCRTTGYPRSELVGRNASLLRSGHHEEAFFTEMWRCLRERGYWRNEVWNRRKDGSAYPQILTISAVRDEAGSTRHYVAIYADISSIKENERLLHDMAHSDSLTGLPNRTLLALRLQDAIHGGRDHTHPLALAYLDLDGFKAVNDRHGHAMGDLLLIELSARISRILRDSDTLARLGGDEFVVLLPELDARSDALRVIERLLEEVAKPVMVGELSLQVSASVGVCFHQRGEEGDAETLLARADAAMYRAKHEGKNRYFVSGEGGAGAAESG